MKDKTKRRIKALGLSEKDFEPKDKNAEIEMALCELADLVDSAITEHEEALVELADIVMGGE